MSEKIYDYVIIGSGIGGLFTGALLARSGFSVCLLEKHYAIGGYGHTFHKNGYSFCAQLHYLWNCSPSEDGGAFFRFLGLEDKIRFTPLNKDGFDQINLPSVQYRIVSGFQRNITALSKRFPSQRKSLDQYFSLITRLNQEIKELPVEFSLSSIIPKLWKFPYLARYVRWTLGDLFNSLRFPQQLQSILAGQSGNLLLPPSKVSLPIHAAMVAGYDQGACVPTHGYEHLFESVASIIQDDEDSKLLRRTEIVGVNSRNGRVDSVVDRKGNLYYGRRFIFNGDPKLLQCLIDDQSFQRSFGNKLRYSYSTSCVTLYIGLRGVDLKTHGFGNWNVWHYTHDDLEEVYKTHLHRHDFSQPSLFISTPTLHNTDTQIAPDGCDQMIVCSHAPFAPFHSAKGEGRAQYKALKTRIVESILDELDHAYIPNLRNHIDHLEAGTPTTNAFWVHAPEGNAYGADLTPSNIRVGKINYKTPYTNLFLAGATASAPSFAAGLHYSLLLFERLTGINVIRKIE